jgi:hypothetical protein
MRRSRSGRERMTEESLLVLALQEYNGRSFDSSEERCVIVEVTWWWDFRTKYSIVQ